MKVFKIVAPLLSAAFFGGLILTTGIESYIKPHRGGLIPSTILEIKANQATQASFTVPTGAEDFVLTAKCDDGVDALMVVFQSNGRPTWFVPCGEEVIAKALNRYFTQAAPFTPVVRVTPLRIHGEANTPVIANLPNEGGKKIPYGVSFGGPWLLTLDARG